MTERLKAGFIGLGAMGEPMARRLAEQQVLTCLWNRTETKAGQLASEWGITQARHPSALAAEVDVVLICVSRDSDVVAVVDALMPDIKPGLIIVDFSTISSHTAIQLAERIKQQGAEFLDIPVTGGVEGARQGTLAMMVGGNPEALEKIRFLLEMLASKIVHMGGHGMGQTAKAVNQIMAAGINQAVTEALAFGVASGIDMNKVIEVVANGAAGNWFLDKRGKTMLAGCYAPGFKLALHHKDLMICEALAEQMGMDLAITRKTREAYERLMQMGYGEEDISALYRLNAHIPLNQTP